MAPFFLEDQDIIFLYAELHISLKQSKPDICKNLRAFAFVFNYLQNMDLENSFFLLKRFSSRCFSIIEKTRR